MLKAIAGRVVCLFGRHCRSRDRVIEVKHVRTSVCVHCGKPMRQQRNRSWVADREARRLRAS